MCNLDSPVIQADGGTRTASVTGGCVALVDGINYLKERGLITGEPLLHLVASVSAGIYNGEPVLDLDYAEDANAETDMNFVMDDTGRFIEVQGTAEADPFTMEQLLAMTALAKSGIAQLIEQQRRALGMT